MFRRVEVAAETVVDACCMKCFRDRFYLGAIEAAEAPQIALKTAADVAQVIQQGVAGSIRPFLVCTAAGTEQPLDGAKQTAAGAAHSRRFQQVTPFRVGDDRRKTGTGDTVNQLANHVRGGSRRDFDENFPAVAQRQRLFQKLGQVFVQIVFTPLQERASAKRASSSVRQK